LSGPSRRIAALNEVAASGISSRKAAMPMVMNGRLTMSFQIACQSKNWSTPI